MVIVDDFPHSAQGYNFRLVNKSLVWLEVVRTIIHVVTIYTGLNN